MLLYTQCEQSLALPEPKVTIFTCKLASLLAIEISPVVFNKKSKEEDSPY